MLTVVASKVAAIVMVIGVGVCVLIAVATRVEACILSAIVVIPIVVVVVICISVAAIVEAKAIVLVVGARVSAWVAGPMVAIVGIAALHKLPVPQCRSSACTAEIPQLSTFPAKAHVNTHTTHACQARRQVEGAAGDAHPLLICRKRASVLPTLWSCSPRSTTSRREFEASLDESCARRSCGAHMVSSECFIAGETSFEGSGLCFPRQSVKSKVQGAGLCVCAARSLSAVGCEAVVLHVTK